MREKLGDVVHPYRIREAACRGERRVAAAAGDIQNALHRKQVDRLT